MNTGFMQLNINEIHTDNSVSSMFVQNPHGDQDKNDFSTIITALLSGHVKGNDELQATSDELQGIEKLIAILNDISGKTGSIDSLDSLLTAISSSPFLTQIVGIIQHFHTNTNPNTNLLKGGESSINFLLPNMSTAKEGKLGETKLPNLIVNNLFSQPKALTKTGGNQLPQNAMAQNVIAKNEILWQSAQAVFNETAEIKNNLFNSGQHKLFENLFHNQAINRGEGVISKLHTQIKAAVESSKESQAIKGINSKDSSLVDRHSMLSTPQAQQFSYASVKSAVEGAVHVNRLSELSGMMAKTLRSNAQHLIIRLEPPDLGNIQIKLIMSNGLLRADFRVDSHAVRDLFFMAMPQIRSALEASGIKVSDFFVDVKGDYYSGEKKQQGYSQQQRQHKEQGSHFFDYFA